MKLDSIENPWAEVQRLIDTNKIEELINRYAKAFDERNFAETMPVIFLNDAHVVLPPGEHRGMHGLADFHHSVMTPFGATQHIFTNILVGLSENTSSFRANTYVTHVIRHHEVPPSSDSEANQSLPQNERETTIRTAEGEALFIAGGVLHGTSVRTLEGWKMENVTLDVIWRYGDFGGPQ